MIRPLEKPQNKYWLTFALCGLAAALMFLFFYIVDKGFFLYAGDFNSQQIAFYYSANEFVKSGGGSFSWATDLGSGFLNSYAFYLAGSPFWWLSLLFPAAWMPYLMVPLLCLKFAVAGGGAYLWMRRYTRKANMAVLGACMYAFSGFTVYNVFFNHFVDVVALFPYFLWALDAAVYEKRRGPFAVLVALNLLNNYFFFAGQVVFLAIYFVCMVLAGRYRINGRTFGALAFESLAGVGMGAILAIPTMLSLQNNPRVSSFSEGFGLLLYGNVQQYAAILYSFFFPPDCPYMPVIFDSGVIKWTSMAAYLPLVSMMGVLAYCRCKKGTPFKWILSVCLVMALVPGLNSMFYAMNSSYYARWYYMPVLIMCAVTVYGLEHEDEVDLKKGLRPTLAVLLAYCAFALVPTETDDGGWKIGVMDYPEKFFLNFGIAFIGVLLFWVLWLMYKRTPQLPRRLTAAVLAFGCLYGAVHISIGKFAQWDNDKDFYQQQYVDARALADILPEGAYRIDDYECYDNLGLWVNRSDLQTFNSTVAPSILEFYPQVGVKRDVRSAPELDKYALRGLLSVKYTICPVDKQEEFEEKAGDNWRYWTTQGQLAVYENTDWLPMAYSYDAYITEEEYEEIPEDYRANLLMRAIVLSEEQINTWGGGLRHLTEEEQTDFDRASYEEDLDARQAMAASSVVLDNWGLTANIQLENSTLVFFPVPYDAGFTAIVNGEEAPVLKVSGGLMAVPAQAGDNSIRLEYHTEGLNVSLALAGVSAVAFAGYLGLNAYARKKRRAALAEKYHLDPPQPRQ
ncbi:YfhO family protein [Allofournierella massiliensis]|uniref:Putative membrane protein YfhO n=1 Tax=Allofournierella massiliensis TaxID=1650663 RepID=A0A4R1QP26_9FIRM|nr:YfhO family protein [Fournierella massiliensis]TCL55077.1 putative membrane protein YfhO [Fournierella massiliensis]